MKYILVPILFSVIGCSLKTKIEKLASPRFAVGDCVTSIDSKEREEWEKPVGKTYQKVLKVGVKKYLYTYSWAQISYKEKLTYWGYDTKFYPFEHNTEKVDCPDDLKRDFKVEVIND